MESVLTPEEYREYLEEKAFLEQPTAFWNRPDGDYLAEDYTPKYRQDLEYHSDGFYYIGYKPREITNRSNSKFITVPRGTYIAITGTSAIDCTHYTSGYVSGGVHSILCTSFESR